MELQVQAETQAQTDLIGLQAGIAQRFMNV